MSSSKELGYSLPAIPIYVSYSSLNQVDAQLYRFMIK